MSHPSVLQVLAANLPVALKAVDCTGNETSLSDCQSSRLNFQDCALPNGTDATVLACANSQSGAPPSHPIITPRSGLYTGAALTGFSSTSLRNDQMNCTTRSSSLQNFQIQCKPIQ